MSIAADEEAERTCRTCDWWKWTRGHGVGHCRLEPRRIHKKGEPRCEHFEAGMAVTVWGERDEMPLVAGRMLSDSLENFERRARVYIGREQRKPLPDNGLIAVLCDAVRLSREHTDELKRFE